MLEADLAQPDLRVLIWSKYPHGLAVLVLLKAMHEKYADADHHDPDINAKFAAAVAKLDLATKDNMSLDNLVSEPALKKRRLLQQYQHASKDDAAANSPAKPAKEDRLVLVFQMPRGLELLTLQHCHRS